MNYKTRIIKLVRAVGDRHIIQSYSILYLPNTCRILNENLKKNYVSIDKREKALKAVIKEGAQKNIEYQNNMITKKPWITAGMLVKMKERRICKNQKNDEGRRR